MAEGEIRHGNDGAFLFPEVCPEMLHKPEQLLDGDGSFLEVWIEPSGDPEVPVDVRVEPRIYLWTAESISEDEQLNLSFVLEQAYAAQLEETHFLLPEGLVTPVNDPEGDLAGGITRLFEIDDLPGIDK